MDFKLYKNDQVDQLFAQAVKATSHDEEKRLYDEIQMLAEGDCVYAYLFRPKQLSVSTNTLVAQSALDVITRGTAAAFVTAGLVSALLFPLVADALLSAESRRTAHAVV